jgi:hypothetical protein
MSSVDIREGIGTPKSGRGRTVPMADDVAQTLASLLKSRPVYRAGRPRLPK